MFVRRGQVLGSVLYSAVPKGAQESSEAAQPEPVAEPESTPAGEKPKDYAPKADWVDYAVSRGADPQEVDDLTKAEIVELYGGQ